MHFIPQQVDSEAQFTERPAPVSPPIQQQRQPQVYQQPPQQYQPPTPPQNQYQPAQYQPPQAQYQPPQPQYQPPQSQYQPAQVQQRSTDSPKPAGYHPPIIERQQTLSRQEQPQKNVSSNVGSLYIPPLQQVRCIRFGTNRMTLLAIFIFEDIFTLSLINNYYLATKGANTT